MKERREEIRQYFIGIGKPLETIDSCIEKYRKDYLEDVEAMAIEKLEARDEAKKNFPSRQEMKD